MKVFYISYKVDELNSVCEHIEAEDLPSAAMIATSKGEIVFIEEALGAIIQGA